MFVYFFWGGVTIAYNTILWLFNQLPMDPSSTERRHSTMVFFASWVSMGAFYLSYLMLDAFPAVLTPDSVNAIMHITTGDYNNTVPFYHTITVQVFYELGMALFGEINCAVAFVNGVQAVFVAVCFAYCIVTLYQIGVPKGALICVFVFYTFVPYNFNYSVTLWKDIPFSVAALLLVTSYYRILKKVGKHPTWNFVVFALGAVGFSLWRTNGWYAFLAMTMVILMMKKYRDRTLLIIMIVVLVVCWVLINPVLSFLNVNSTDMVEALSIPLQQIARVVSQGVEFTAEEEELLSQAFHMEQLGALYKPYLSDPVKFEGLRRENMDYIKAHIFDYVKLYINLGIRNFDEYLWAWVEQTKGFWNGGYDYWVNRRRVDWNSLGIERVRPKETSVMPYQALFYVFEEPMLMKPLYSIGYNIWIVLTCFFINLIKKRDEFLISIPIVVLIVGLWIGTPVFAEFRYAYPVFVSLPIILLTTLYYRQNHCC